METWCTGSGGNPRAWHGDRDVRFGRGRYTNRTDGTAHAAILLEVALDGVLVVDQWVGQPVAKRVIRYRGGQGRPANDGDAFYVIEETTPPAS